MAETGHEPGGWSDATRRIARSLLGLIHTRFSLFAVELQEEKVRALDHLVWLAVGVALGTAGLLVAIATMAIFLWNISGYLGLIGLAAAVLTAAVAIVWRVRRQMLGNPPPFAATTSEFEKDFQCLNDQD